MSGPTRGYAHRVDIQTTATAVWQALTDTRQVALWYARESHIDTRAGGRYWARSAGEFEREAHIDVFDAPRRLRLIYLHSADMPETDAVLVDDFLLSDTGDTTVLRLLGAGVPQSMAWNEYFLQLRDDWVRRLRRLKLLAERQLVSGPT